MSIIQARVVMRKWLADLVFRVDVMKVDFESL